MIPVLIVPVINRFDLMEQMLASIEVPVGRLVVIDNARGTQQWRGENWFPAAFDPPFGSAHVMRPLINLGFSGSINTAIRQTPDAPWWMWASVDLTFGTGDLLNVVHLIEDARGPRVVTGTRDDERLLRFAYAAINREAIEAVGLLDEDTFFPVYLEDDDYERRCHLGGVEWITYDGAISHERSATIADPTMARENSRTFPENAARYAAKWGGPPGSETFSRPWGKPVPLSYAPVDIAGRARRTWSTP